jgi:DNA polymerase-1
VTETAADITDVDSVRPIFETIAKNGINVDLAGLVKKSQELVAEESAALDELDDLAEYRGLRERQPKAFSKKDTRFNPRSKKHINAWLVDRGEEETHSVAEDNIETRLPADMFELIMKARRLRKFHGDLQTLRKFMTADGKIHVQWTEAITGRWYTGKPPIQTMAKVCRNYLVPDEGNGFYVIDWSQQELRILAMVSQDPDLLRAFEEKKDPHVAAFERVTGNAYAIDTDPELAKTQREIGKMLNYALIYGLDAQGLGKRLRIDNTQAQSLINKYFQAFPRLAEWRQEQRQKVEETGYVETLGGRRIPVERNPKRRDADEEFTRKAVNYFVQGSAADQLVALLILLKQKIFSGTPLIDLIRATIHDALLLEIPLADEGKLIVSWFREAMEQPLLNILNPVEVKGPSASWRECMDWVEDA